MIFSSTRLLGLAIAAAACGQPWVPSNEQDWDSQRRWMVATQLRERGISNLRVLDAMARVPRHRFVPDEVRAASYGDHPLPIGFGQTISQPYIVAFMTEALKIESSDRVLEIGTGSGYQAAILGELAREVYTIEIIPELAETARRTLEELGYRNVHVRAGNGYLGWPEAAPFDRVIVTAAPDEVPPALVQQLKVGGVMAIPVGSVEQELRILRRTPTDLVRIATLPVRFVPMTGKPKTRLRVPDEVEPARGKDPTACWKGMSISNAKCQMPKCYLKSFSILHLAFGISALAAVARH